MAFQSNGPVMLALPPFRGVTRRIILIALAAFFGLAVLGLVIPAMARELYGLTVLVPYDLLHGELWQLLSYPFVGDGLLSVGFALLSVWFFGSTLEDERGGGWLLEYFFVTMIGGGLLASAVVLALGGSNAWIPFAITAGLWPFVLAVIVAFAYFNPEAPLRFQFFFTVKAKYLAAIYVLVYLALSLRGADRFGAVVAVMSALCGFAYLRLAPRRGLRAGFSEWWYGLRNAYYRRKRQKAAKKFVVYMKKQGQDVNLNDDGRYVDPNGTARDLDDKKWMN